MAIPEGKGEKGTEKILEVIAENFPKVTIDPKPQIRKFSEQ